MIDAKFIPVVVIDKLEDTEAILGALCRGGLPVAEITFRTSCAAEAIALGKEKFPAMCIGAGTVLTVAQCKAALASGAEFIVSPGLSPAVAKYCRRKGIPYFPGCVTPTEIMAALELGLTTIKFFPAGVFGGLKALKALSSAFPQVRFIPTGGVDMSNLDEYLRFDKIQAIGGSFLLKGDIEANTRALMEKLK